MSIFSVADSLANKLGVETSHRHQPQWVSTPKEEAPEPYQPTEEELRPQGPWAEADPETIEVGEPIGMGPSGKKIVKAPPTEFAGLSDEDLSEMGKQLGINKDPAEEKAQAIKMKAIGEFITAAAARKGLEEMPDLIGLTIDGEDEQLLFYDKVSLQYRPIIRRMQVDVPRKELSKLIRELGNE